MRNVIATRGATLIELVVTAINGLLAGYVAPTYFSLVGKSEVQVAKAQIDALEKATEQYGVDMRRSRRSRRTWSGASGLAVLG